MVCWRQHQTGILTALVEQTPTTNTTHTKHCTILWKEFQAGVDNLSEVFDRVAASGEWNALSVVYAAIRLVAFRVCPEQGDTCERVGTREE
jgi:hypothetical protein